MPSEDPPTTFLKFMYAVGRAIDGPVTWWRESVVVPNQQKYYWYHRKYPRVPTVDQCYTDDPMCIFEADQQLQRDMQVDGQIVSILRQRAQNCVRHHGGQGDNAKRECQALFDIYEDAAGSYFCKYGDLGYDPSSKDVYMKQKHRMIWERRYGKVGSGITPQE